MLFLFNKADPLHIVQSYFSIKNNSPNEQLENLVKQIKRYKYDEKQEILKILTFTKTMLRRQMKKSKNSHNLLRLIFKSLLMIHKFVANGVLGKFFQDLLVQIQQAIQCLSILSQQKLNQVTKKLLKHSKNPSIIQLHTRLNLQKQILQQKFLKPYHYYLSKRCQMLDRSFNNTQKCYYLINLLNSACCCNKVIYLVARYNFNEFQFVADFNTILAQDVQGLYILLKSSLEHQKKRYYKQDDEQDTSCSSQGEEKQQKLQICQITDILRSLHQQLFHIFYNKYYYRLVFKFIPQWIDLQKQEQKQKSVIKVRQRSNKSKRKNQQITLIQSFYPSLQSKEIALEETFQTSQLQISSTNQISQAENCKKKSIRKINHLKAHLQNSINLLKDMEKLVEQIQNFQLVQNI